MSNSKLISYTKLSPNHSGKRVYPITKITIHHMAGNLTVEQCGALFANSARQVSSNYGIGTDGRIALYVDEANRAWTSSNYDNDQRAITIEVANCSGDPDWKVSDKAYDSLIKLCVDICKRNGIKKLNFTGDKSGNLTMHKYFAATGCPGPYLEKKFPEIASKVNAQLTEKPKTTEVKYKVNSAKLNIRKGPSTKYDIVGRITDKGIYSVTQTKKVGCQTWGKLKSGAGWICLNIEYAAKK